MTKGTTALQQALRKPEQAQPAPAAPSRSYRAPSRDGTVAISVYLPADFKRSLRLVQAQSGQSLQAIVAEALNDLFAKYRVPAVAAERKR